jgi:hypothetical protein
MPDLPDRMSFLNDLIVARHAELARMVAILDRGSQARSRLAKRLKIALIVLGAFSASQAVVLEVAGTFTLVTSVVFAGVGITIAAIAGIETAFKFETRAYELRLLGAKCQAARFQHNSEWAYRIAIAEVEHAIAAARDLLAIQDQTISEVHLEAAKLGVSLVPVRGRRSWRELRTINYEVATWDDREDVRDTNITRDAWDTDRLPADDDLPAPDYEGGGPRGTP